eukprot:1340526-Amphidinium_carterae.1
MTTRYSQLVSQEVHAAIVDKCARVLAGDATLPKASAQSFLFFGKGSSVTLIDSCIGGVVAALTALTCGIGRIKCDSVWGEASTRWQMTDWVFHFHGCS